MCVCAREAALQARGSGAAGRARLPLRAPAPVGPALRGAPKAPSSFALAPRQPQAAAAPSRRRRPTFIRVMLEGARSAEPPIRPGRLGASAFSMVWLCRRVARPLSAGGRGAGAGRVGGAESEWGGVEGAAGRAAGAPRLEAAGSQPAASRDSQASAAATPSSQPVVAASQLHQPASQLPQQPAQPPPARAPSEVNLGSFSAQLAGSLPVVMDSYSAYSSGYFSA